MVHGKERDRVILGMRLGIELGLEFGMAWRGVRDRDRDGGF